VQTLVVESGDVLDDASSGCVWVRQDAITDKLGLDLSTKLSASAWS
jgi:hypothetical protein